MDYMKKEERQQLTRMFMPDRLQEVLGGKRLPPSGHGLFLCRCIHEKL